jgi:hypothetical protein
MNGVLEMWSCSLKLHTSWLDTKFHSHLVYCWTLKWGRRRDPGGQSHALYRLDPLDHATFGQDSDEYFGFPLSELYRPNQNGSLYE